MFSSRANLAVLIVCLAFLGIVAGVKIQELADQPEISADRSAGEAIAEQVAPQTVDSSFYRTSAQTSTSSVDSAASTQSSAQSSAPAPARVSAAPAPAVPVIPADTVSAEAYLVGDVSTGKIYLEKNPASVLPAASMSKLLTAITSTDMYASTTEIEITSAETDVPPDASDLQAGERFTAGELLYPLLLDSSNVAAEALASSTDLGAFLQLMTSYAWEIGMSGSFSADPAGLSEDDQGSVSGFFKLAQYLYRSRPDILAITRIAHISVATTTDHGAHDFVSIHPFVDDPRFIGGKTGYTYAAEDTMLTILNIDGHPLAFIVLRSLDRTKDTDLLITKVQGMLTGDM